MYMKGQRNVPIKPDLKSQVTGYNIQLIQLLYIHVISLLVLNKPHLTVYVKKI
jgi:hypothetical protein